MSTIIFSGRKTSLQQASVADTKSVFLFFWYSPDLHSQLEVARTGIPIKSKFDSRQLECQMSNSVDRRQLGHTDSRASRTRFDIRYYYSQTFQHALLRSSFVSALLWTAVLLKKLKERIGKFLATQPRSIKYLVKTKDV